MLTEIPVFKHLREGGRVRFTCNPSNPESDQNSHVYLDCNPKGKSLRIGPLHDVWPELRPYVELVSISEFWTFEWTGCPYSSMSELLRRYPSTRRETLDDHELSKYLFDHGWDTSALKQHGPWNIFYDTDGEELAYVEYAGHMGTVSDMVLTR